MCFSYRTSDICFVALVYCLFSLVYNERICIYYINTSGLKFSNHKHPYILPYITPNVSHNETTNSFCFK